MNARVSTVAIEIICPKCEVEVPAYNGSLYWDVNELPKGNRVECPSCQRELNVKIPKETK